MKGLRSLSLLALIAIAGGLLFLAAYLASAAMPVQDMAQYWSAAHLVSQNPYSFDLVSQLEHANGIHIDPPLVLKNPPWSIPFILPLGLFSYRVDFALWTVLSIAILLFCTHAIWRELTLPPSLIPLILPLIFGPALVQLMLGQWTILVLPGVTIFLIAVSRKQDWLAGASLLLVLGKPHVMLLFLIAVALWIGREKKWAVLVSGFIAVLTASALVEVINPLVFAQFWQRTIQVVQENYSYPNLGGWLFLISGKHWTAILPQFAGLIWLGFYWKRHRSRWNWWDQGTLVILCSVLFSYYSYPYDEVVALPALLIAFALGNRWRLLAAFIITSAGYFSYILGVAGHFGFGYMFLWWTASGWLVTVLLANAQSRLVSMPERES